MAEYKWKPIEPLAPADKSIDLADIRPLYESWHAAHARLVESSPTSLQKFTERLIRRLSVETGILERLYELDRGTTEALIAAGFVEDLVSHSSTDVEPGHLIDFLRDHEAAIQLAIDCLKGDRALTKGVIHELHAVLTQHQETTTAIDQFGVRREIPLLKGQFKAQPNNPKRPDGSFHEYAPPISVDLEVENLLNWLGDYSAEDPIIVAAWLHHRFTQIHPYQDGNGRVARVLTTYVLLRADLLPLVIDRDLRTEYVSTLESADTGDLSKLAGLFARLERAAILEALSIDIDAEVEHERTLTDAVISSLTARLKKRREEKHAELRQVNTLAQRLRGRTSELIGNTFTKLERPVAIVGDPQTWFTEGGPDKGNAHWYKFEVVKSANEAGKYANLAEDHYFVKASILASNERLVFVTSFHHVGRELSGIMEATAFARLESFEDSDDRESVTQDFFVCSVEPFVFTHRTSEDQIADAFETWLDTALAVAIKEYGDRL